MSAHLDRRPTRWPHMHDAWWRGLACAVIACLVAPVCGGATTGAIRPQGAATTQQVAQAPPPSADTRLDSRIAAQWEDARAALKASAGQLTLSGALAALLGAGASGDLETLSKFEKSVRGLPWKSALAMGVGNGHIYYGWAASERADITATGNAARDCQRLAGSPCVVVMANGKFDEAAFLGFSKWLGTQAQAVVRGDLLHKMRTNPYQGGVGSIERGP